ncbi:MAG TPA: CARDB domain-containing protein [Candidatus Thermoplasmatota archaeon]|nr:CARDB domain-containing protein [Candidatus Thermoplasmatota archaeon]
MLPRRPGPLLAVALLLAALGASLPWAGAQATLSADLVVQEVQPGTPRVGFAGALAAVVRNDGPADPLTFNVTFAWNANETLRTLAYPADGANFTAANGSGPPPEDCLSVTAGFRHGCAIGVRFDWTPPEDHAGPGNLTARIAAGVGYADPVSDNDAATAPAFVERHALALDLDARDDHAKSTGPGQAAFYRVSIANGGNVEERVDARLTGAATWPSSGLVGEGSAAPTANLTLRLAPGASAALLAVLQAPASGGANVTARVEIASQAAPDVHAERTLPATSIGAAGTFGFRADAPETLEVGLGLAVAVNLTLTNTANAEDAIHWTFGEALPAGWEVLVEPAWQLLDAPAGARSEARLSVLANATLPPGSNATLRLGAASLNGNASANVTLALHTSAADLTIASLAVQRGGAAVPLEDMAIYQGDVLDLRALVRNAGPAPLPKPARIVLEVRVPGQPNATAAEQLVGGLGPGEERDVFLRWDAGNLSGSVELAVRADPEGSVAELREDNNELARAVVVRLHGLQVAAPADRSALPGQQLVYEGPGSFAVRNLGNAPERVQVELTTPHGWVNDTRFLELAPGATGLVPLTFQVPTFPGTVSEALRAEASLTNRSATRADAATTIAIDDREAPVLERLEAPANATLGDSVPFRAVLRDAVGVARAAIWVRFGEGAERNQSLESSDGTNWTGAVVATQPGPASYWIVAVDATPANHTLNTSTTPGGLLVEVGGAPLVELLEPRNGTAIRPGVLIKLRVSDVHGIASVAVRDGARTFEVPEPYAINTSGWAEGLHDLEVTARNGFGNAATARFAVVIDATPPLLRDARVEPARPAPGQELRVEAHASDAVTGSVLVVRASNGEVLREVRASVGIGLLTANFSIPEAGRYNLGLRVADQAGNEGVLSLPVEIGGGLPGLPSLGTLALLAAAALLRRHGAR